jgi:enoyl-CoA hydratase/carnithine racemase
VRLERRGGVALLTLDDPPVNAMSNALLERLGDLVEEIAADREIGAVVLTGTGEKAFAAGAKLPELAATMADCGAMVLHTSLSRRALDGLGRLPQPVIAAVQAAAIGGGFELALACDVSIVDETAKVGLPEVGLGLIPGAGGTQRLPRLVGAPRATMLILSGRLLSAAEAERVGAITATAPAGEAPKTAMELAESLARKPVAAVEAALRSIRAAAGTDLASGLDREREEFLDVLATADAAEGVAAFIERRTPNFARR